MSTSKLRLVRLAPDLDLPTTLGHYAKKRRDSSFARHPVTRIARSGMR